MSPRSHPRVVTAPKGAVSWLWDLAASPSCPEQGGTGGERQELVSSAGLDEQELGECSLLPGNGSAEGLGWMGITGERRPRLSPV